MKKAIACFALLAACLFAACNVFFTNNTGEEGSLTLSLGSGGPAAGTHDAGAIFYLPGSDENGEGVAFPTLGNSRIVVYNSAGKILRDYSFTQGQASLQFSIPAGGPYWVDFSAPVVHPANTGNEAENEIVYKDPFPFVKSFGATVKVDTVEKGSSQELFLPLRVRETAIMAPYRYTGETVDTKSFTPFYDLPENFPADRPFIDRGTDEICLEFDPYGRVFTTGKKQSLNLLRFNNFLLSDSIYNSLSSLTDSRGLAFNLRNGRLYHAYTHDSNIYYAFEHNVSGQTPKAGSASRLLYLDSAVITIDEDGTLYGIDGKQISVRPMGSYYSRAYPVSTFDIGKLIGFLGREIESTPQILDLKALNGYLYVLLAVPYVDDTTDQTAYYDYFAAIPLESIKQGNVEGAWYAGGRSVDELDEKDHNTGSNSREGFFGPKKFVGWGPDRIYVYDYQGFNGNYYNGGKSFHRIVEVDLLNHKISRAGLIVDING